MSVLSPPDPSLVSLDLFTSGRSVSSRFLSVWREAGLPLLGLRRWATFPTVCSLVSVTFVHVSHVVAVLTLWLRRVKECVLDLWKMAGGRLLPDNSSLRQQLAHIIWTNAESPVSHWISILQSTESFKNQQVGTHVKTYEARRFDLQFVGLSKSVCNV